MIIETIPFDPARYLGTADADVEFLHDAFESGDAGYIAHALGIVVRARGMSEVVARQAGLSFEALSHALSPSGDPTHLALLDVLKVLNIRLDTSRRHAK